MIAHPLVFRHLILGTGLAAEQILEAIQRFSREQDAAGTSFAPLVHSVRWRSPPLDEVDQRSLYLLRLLAFVPDLRRLDTGPVATRHMFHIIDNKLRGLWYLSTAFNPNTSSFWYLIGNLKSLRKLVIHTSFPYSLPLGALRWNLPLLQTIVWNDTSPTGPLVTQSAAGSIQPLESCQLERLENFSFHRLNQRMSAEEGESWERLLSRQSWNMISMDLVAPLSADLLSKTRVNIIEVRTDRLRTKLVVPPTCRAITVIHDLDTNQSYGNLDVLLTSFEAISQSPMSLREVYFALKGSDPARVSEDETQDTVIKRVMHFNDVLAELNVVLYDAGDGDLELQGLPRHKSPYADVFDETC